MKPRARGEGLLLRAVDDELIVYDCERHHAHCLNATAAEVWRWCDGRTTLETMAARLAPVVGARAAAGAVQLALAQLERARLLTGQPASGLSRRELLRRIGRTAAIVAALPAVTSIVSPTPAQAASPCVPNTPGCAPDDDPCTSSADCCSCCCRNVGGGMLLCKPGGGGCIP